MASKFKEKDKIVIKPGILSGDTNGTSFYLTDEMYKHITKEPILEVYIADGKAIKIIGGEDYWYYEDWFNLAEFPDPLEKYTIREVFHNLTEQSVCITHLKKGINDIIKALCKTDSAIDAYQSFRDYINVNSAVHNHLYESHTGKRRYAASILSIMIIEHYAAELVYVADNIIEKLPSYVRADYVQYVHSHHLQNTTIATIAAVKLINPQESDQIMPTVDNKVAVQQVTFIYGNDAAIVTDDNIFEMIRTLEAKIENSSKIKNKPKKLETQIESYKAEIDELVKFVDAR